jgi:glycerol-3-phosphate acyltransferase PlsY
MMQYINESFIAKLPETPGSLPLLILGVAVAYLVGNLNPAILMGRLYGIDIRQSGSGNPGSTNTLRTLGGKAGAAVLVIDILKGYFTVVVAMRLAGVPYSMLCGLAVVIGHMFPALHGFRGGKGVAATLGVLMAMNLGFAIVLVGMFGLATLLFRIVSVSVLCAIALAVPLSASFGNIYPLWIVIICALIVIKHRANIVRIIKKEEPKLSIGRADK